MLTRPLLSRGSRRGLWRLGSVVKMGRLSARLFLPLGYFPGSRRPVPFFRSRRASVGRAYETGAPKTKPRGYDPVEGPNAFPSCIFFTKKEGLDIDVIPLEWGHFLWCPFELLAGISFRVRSWILFTGDLM
jgi:hypothetical protein